jgi:hypothetical protein
VCDAIVKEVPIHGGVKDEEASSEGEVDDGASEANKGGSRPSTRCFLETHRVWRGSMIQCRIKKKR